MSKQRPTPSSTCSPDTAGSPSPSRLWPTPNTQDAKGAGSVRSREDGKQAQLHDTVRRFAPSASRRSSPMPLPSSLTDGPASPTSGMSETSRRIRYFASAVFSRWSSRAGSPVSPTATPGSDRPASTNATSGMNAPECLGSFDPASRSSRTSPGYLALSQDFFSTEFYRIWPKSGMAVNGKLYPLPPLEPPTAESASGSSAGTSEGEPDGLPLAWPTATARDYKGAYRPESMIRSDGKSRAWDTLDQAVATASDWPTPTTSEGSKITSQANYGQVGLSNHPAIVGLPTRPKGTKDRKGQPDSGPPPTASGLPDPENRNGPGSPAGLSEDWPTPSASRGNHTSVNPDAAEANRERGQQMGLGYKVALAEKSWATPRATEIETGQNAQGGLGLTSQVKSTQAGKLNPSWVETLMGLPLGHTQLPQKFVKQRKDKAA